MPITVRFVGAGDAFGSGGRFQTCIVVDGPGCRFAIDFGASSLIALSQQGIEHNSLDAILLTHLHRDHAAGVPFLLIDAMLAARRTRPLAAKFPLDWIEMEPGRGQPVLDLVVTPERARHTRETNPTALRIQVGDRVVTYPGDTEWTPTSRGTPAGSGRNA